MSAGSDTFRPCVIIPSYNNPQTIGRVVSAVRAYVPDVIVVDDGSGLEGRAAIAEVGASGLATVHHRAANGGKGAAVKDALRLARDAGFTHALQVDADGQHTLDDIPAMLEAARETPTALVLGQPVFDDTAPKARLVGRRITIFWTRLEVGGGAIADPMCGFRVYPLPISAEVPVWGDRMDFDPEIAVRLVWAGVPTRNVPTRVRYVSADEGGVSHFHAFKDNVLISLMHSRLMTMRIMGFLFGWLFRGARGEVAVMSGDGKRHVVSVELEVPFHDVDSLNIVWHGHYYKYVEIARTALMRSVQLDNDQLRALGCGLVMGETQCKHTGVLRYGDRFRVDAWFKDVSQRLCIAYEVRNLTSGKRAARARTVLVTLNGRGELNLATPPEVVARIEAVTGPIG